MPDTHLQVLAANAGLNVVEKSLSHVMPAPLCLKPMLSVQLFIHSIDAYSRKGPSFDLLHHTVTVSDENTLAQLRTTARSSPCCRFRWTETSCVPPSSTRSGHLYLVLLSVLFISILYTLQLYSFVFAGYCWNPETAADMLGHPRENYFDGSVVKEALALLLLPGAAHLTSSASVSGAKAAQLAAEQLKVLLGVLMGDAVYTELQMEGERPCALPKTALPGLPSMTELGKAEKLLWTLLEVPLSRCVIARPLLLFLLLLLVTEQFFIPVRGRGAQSRSSRAAPQSVPPPAPVRPLEAHRHLPRPATSSSSFFPFQSISTPSRRETHYDVFSFFSRRGANPSRRSRRVLRRIEHPRDALSGSHPSP